MFIVYGLEGLWLVVPSLLASLLPTGYPIVDIPTERIVTWLASSSPVDVFWEVSNVLLSGGPAGRFGATLVISGRGASYAEMINRMMGWQMAAGIVLAVLAAVQLRPVFRRRMARRAGRAG